MIVTTYHAKYHGQSMIFQVKNHTLTAEIEDKAAVSLAVSG